MCGLLLFGEYRNWTVEQTAGAWCFDVSVVLLKATDGNGQSARVMQNPSDVDAGYDGHKGPGVAHSRTKSCRSFSFAEKPGAASRKNQITRLSIKNP